MTITKTEKKVLIYVAIFIAISINMTKLLSLFANKENVIGIPWRFNLPEILYQTIYFGFFSYFLGYLLLKLIYLKKYSSAIPF